jgi:preprotein translocase subunit SecD
MSVVIGGILVILAMAIYYRKAGLIANFVLILNLVFIMAMLSLFKATLTLPGIAGIVLTVGMAVDANVLIFERIREEVRLGKTARAALDAGYAKALSTIIDANITTLIAALVLFQFGTGPVKGFAVTLSIGIVATLFSALFVSRVIFDFFLERRQVKRLSI